MLDVSDIEKAVDDCRAFAVSDHGSAMGIRMFDGITYLLVEVIRELRIISEKLDNQPGRPGDD